MDLKTKGDKLNIPKRQMSPGGGKHSTGEFIELLSGLFSRVCVSGSRSLETNRTTGSDRTSQSRESFSTEMKCRGRYVLSWNTVIKTEEGEMFWQAEAAVCFYIKELVAGGKLRCWLLHLFFTCFHQTIWKLFRFCCHVRKVSSG